MHTHTYAYTHNGNYSAMRKDEILPFATVCMELASSMLNERSQMRKTNAAWYHLDWNLGKKRQTHRNREEKWLPLTARR